MVNRICSLIFSFGLIGLATQAWADKPQFMGYLENSNTTVTLEEGWYAVTNDVTITSSEVGKPGIDCTAKAQYLYVPEGVTLTVKGCDGEGRTGGSAGIRIPKGKALYVAGCGTIEATGGNAAKGGDGEVGGDAEFDLSQIDQKKLKCRGGYGGAGGVGGGGAGAGIGTDGGLGGESSGKWEADEWREGSIDSYYFMKLSNPIPENSIDANLGENPEEMGILVTCDKVKLIAKGGNEGAGGQKGGQDGQNAGYTFRVTDSEVNVVWAVGGADGGGGGGGSAGMPIGTGGCGGNAGETGGYGGCDCAYEWTESEPPEDWWHNLVRTAISGFGGLGGANKDVIDIHGYSSIPNFGPGQDGTTSTTRGLAYKNIKGPFLRRTGSVAYSSYEYRPDVSGISQDLCPEISWSSNSDWYKFTLTLSVPEETVDFTATTVSVDIGHAPTKTWPKVKSIKPFFGFDGFNDKEDGSGRDYFDRKMSFLGTYDTPWDVTVYPKLIDATKLPTGIFVDGVEVDPEAKVLSGDGWIFEDYTIKLNKEDKEYSIFGTNEYGVVAIKAEKSCKVKVDKPLHLAYGAGLYPGGIMVAPKATLGLKINAYSSIDAQSVENMCAIHCPVGATLNITSSLARGLSFEQGPSGNMTLTIDQTQMTRSGTPVFKSGFGAAAIGSKKDEPSGDITLDNCHVNVNQGRTIPTIGHGQLTDESIKLECGEIVFKNMPRLYSGVIDTTAKIVVSPRPHNEYGRPLLWVGPGEEMYFVPAGTMDMRYYSSSGTKMIWKALVKHNSATVLENKAE